MMLPEWNQILHQFIKILRLFPSPNLGWPVEQSILTVAHFDLPAAWELRWASDKMATKSLDSDIVWACIFLFKVIIAT